MTEICKACQDPLIISLDPDESENGEEQPQSVPDDLLLPCGCHFHWQCLLDKSPTVARTLSCPSCNSYLPSNGIGASSSSSSTPASANPVILTHYTNEGGVDPSLDIYPSLAEEAYLAAHPEARPARAFHTLASEGEVQGMVELLADVDGNEETPLSAAQLLTWRDPLNGGRSALHVALEARQEEAVWLLLWLGSRVKTEDFPEAVVQVAAANGLPRRLEEVKDGEDVRFVKDERGRTAGDVCLELGEPWTKLVEGGLFV
ncbi:hypothetical protein VTH82DRAFT_8466 [Thermothelomyces myriococcoides]